MTEEALTPLQRLEKRIDEQDACIALITQIMEAQDRAIEILERDLNKFMNDKRKALGRTIDVGITSGAPGSQTETLLSEIVGRAAKRKYNE